MIFKKPYAFFIKNFKLFHFILFVLSSILLYRTSLVYSFLKEYIKSSPNVIGKELTDTLFTGYSYILIVFMIITNILLIVIMVKKVKPYMYYVVNIVLYISVLFIFLYSHRVIGNLEVMLVEAKTVMAVRDILNIARLLQTLSMIFFLIRATGFDIKKFDFRRDLQELDISEEDSEEYEVSIEFEGNEVVRNIKRILRGFKYYYKENKLIVNVIVLLFISLIFLLVYLSTDRYSRTYDENEYFNVGNISFVVKNSNILTKNYRNEDIASQGNVLVAVKIAARSTMQENLQITRMPLVIDGVQYYSVSGYNSDLVDLGNVYTNQTLTTDFTDYVLVYQIPAQYVNSSMLFRYIDNISYKSGDKVVNSINVKLKPNDLDSMSGVVNQFNLGDEVSFNNYKITISDYDIQDKFVNTYNSCVVSNECYDFSEVIKPSVLRNSDKVVLRLNGTVSYDSVISDIKSLYDVVSKFGVIEYVYNGVSYTETNDFNLISPSRTGAADTYYIEVNKNILYASDIKLSFALRNNVYEYILRGDISE